MTSPSGTHDDRSMHRPEPPRREFDALAELFLGDADGAPDVFPFPRREDGATSAPRPLPMTQRATPSVEGAAPADAHARAGTRVEVLLMGHLPVRSGPWALQYAASVARHEHIPVALLRMSPAEEGESPRVSIDLLGTQPAWTGDRNPSFVEALAHARASAQRWIVLVGELDEANVLTMAGIDSITVLSGANEAAVVDAYRMLKAMASHEDADDAPAVRISIMGADDERADAAGRKLQHGARTFLNLDVELAPPLGKMGPTGSTSLFRGSAPLSAEDLVALIRAQDDLPAPATQVRSEVRPTAEPSAATFAEPKIPAPPDASRLVALVDGLRSLDVACPAAPEVQFAADEQGRLHVLADGALALQALSQAAAWADLHRTLIGQAIGAAIPTSMITQHVFAHDAKAMRWLLDTPVRIHLITRATVRGESVTVACALN
ncbi:MAG: hypothetical protein KDA20_03640 [Phycisphaerales bacterium]|nr:hypothetical protein [Phycisphaerales bacterium]